jgi:hypothetical protein
MTSTAIGAEIEKTMSPGLKKMLLLFEVGRTPEIDGRGLPSAAHPEVLLCEILREEFRGE